ncbi:MAG: terminase family protein, partial [Anaerolineales bacterium]|nr:terminase family protein [Anaerolineales bacterium]
MAEVIDIAPQAGPQTAFFESPADIVFYGGAAGGGKSWALLIEPLRHLTTVDGFGGVIFRRTSPQITNEGGLWDESQKIYSLCGATPREHVHDWTFPPFGNTISFRHLQHEKNKLDWQGAQIPYLGFDELTHFTHGQFFYLLSRSRSTCGVTPYIRAAYNPVPPEDPIGGWIHDFVGWYIDDDGYPIEERSGVVRWFINVQDQLHWFSSEAEARQSFPDIPPTSFTYIKSSVEDNQILLDKDPSYLAKLHALPLVEMERLLKGNHKIMPAAGNVFKRSWFNIVEAIPAGDAIEVLFWDFAATAKEQTKDDPDFTAYNHMRRIGNYGAYSFCIRDAGADQLDPADTEAYFLNISRQKAAQAKREGVLLVVAWEEEPGSASKRETARMIKALAGIVCGGIRSHKDKVVRATPLAVAAKAGNVSLLDAAWNRAWLTHMHNQPEWPHDDEMDAASGSFNALTDPEFLKNLVQRRGV